MVLLTHTGLDLTKVLTLPHKMSAMELNCDFLVIGTGLAGLTYALKVADLGRVIIIAKSDLSAANSSLAQGGVASVGAKTDSFEQHIEDTLRAGAGLCNENIVRKVIEQGPARIQELIDLGVKFDDSLTREGGHLQRRVWHVDDQTGSAIHRTLLEKCLQNEKIKILESHFAIDLITDQKIEPLRTGSPVCVGAYVFDVKQSQVKSVMSRNVVLATGGAGKVYLYTSNWDGATGDGIAMAYRIGARIANMEFMQFHPTCLFHPKARNFLITEAIRGEGGELINKAGEAFMKKYDPMGSLAPRDIVARSIDAEMKKSGADCVFLDITHQTPEFIISRFPNIYKKCLDLGIDMTKEPIPVVPAAHYLCGGILVDEWGRTDIPNLFAIGESACTGLHGANRLASNSLLECMAFAHSASVYTRDHIKEMPVPVFHAPKWTYFGNQNEDEMAAISHMWDEIRRLMWNYVGIVRSNRRLERAAHRLQNLRSEIKDYYWNFKVHPDILELRNISLVAELTVQCALKRKESRGIHFNINYPPKSEDKIKAKDTIISPCEL